MIRLSPGKLRGLQRCATPKGRLSVLALDHRNNLRQALNPQDPSSVSDQQLTEFKLQVTRTLAPHASAVLLDPQFGAFQAISSGALPPDRGLIVALEATGYTGDPTLRESRILEGWSVAKAKHMGADAVKLLVYYHPKAETAGQIEALVSQVSKECQAHDLLLMLEPLSYSIEPAQKKVAGDERRQVVTETARRLTALGGDVLKAEFPVDIATFPKESDWQAACDELTSNSRVPWVLLSASVDFETYKRQVSMACQQGASGVAAGRAVWKEAVDTAASQRISFLEGLAAERMRSLTQLVDEMAAPWERYFQPDPTPSNDYRAYDEPDPRQ